MHTGGSDHIGRWAHPCGPYRWCDQTLTEQRYEPMRTIVRNHVCDLQGLACKSKKILGSRQAERSMGWEWCRRLGIFTPAAMHLARCAGAHFSPGEATS